MNQLNIQRVGVAQTWDIVLQGIKKGAYHTSSSKPLGYSDLSLYHTRPPLPQLLFLNSAVLIFARPFFTFWLFISVPTSVLFFVKAASVPCLGKLL